MIVIFTLKMRYFGPPNTENLGLGNYLLPKIIDNSAVDCRIYKNFVYRYTVSPRKWRDGQDPLLVKSKLADGTQIAPKWLFNFIYEPVLQPRQKYKMF